MTKLVLVRIRSFSNVKSICFDSVGPVLVDCLLFGNEGYEDEK
jgi:hypothetical protein